MSYVPILLSSGIVFRTKGPRGRKVQLSSLVYFQTWGERTITSSIVSFFVQTVFAIWAESRLSSFTLKTPSLSSNSYFSRLSFVGLSASARQEEMSTCPSGLSSCPRARKALAMSLVPNNSQAAVDIRARRSLQICARARLFLRRQEILN